jgi:hypothetical protein
MVKTPTLANLLLRLALAPFLLVCVVFLCAAALLLTVGEVAVEWVNDVLDVIEGAANHKGGR